MQSHAQETQKNVVDTHIALYVNDYSVSLGEQGRKAVEKVFEKLNKSAKEVFIGE